MPDRTFRTVLDELAAGAQSTVEKGRKFERLVKAFLERDNAQTRRFLRVWLWGEWPGNNGRHDIGIDIVAEERDSGELVAIQCKFYAPATRIVREHVNSFLGAYGSDQFAKGIFVSTSDVWTGNAEEAVANFGKPVARWGPDVFENSSIDWSTFDLDYPADLTPRQTKTLWDYQDAALQDTMAGFDEYDRGKLIMACGSGKTFTALRIAERIASVGGTVLFLTPSISLLSQSLIDWANDADLPLKPFAVCSDTRAGRRSSDDEDMSPYDLTETPSTNTENLAERFRRADRQNNMTVVFSTYQSLDVVAAAQKQRNGLPEFDLIICDEAHRTTGVSARQLTGKDESNFQRVHDNGFITSQKRLYMTATPRIYGDRARRKANDSQLVLASMDDETLYGPEFHRLGFGRAIELSILSDYKVIIFNVDQEQIATDLDNLLSDSANAVNMDNGARMVGCWNGLGKRSAEGLDFSADPQPAKRAVAFSNAIRQSKQFAEYFPDVINSCITAAGDDAENTLRCEVNHVDGTQNALARANHLAWLRREPEAGVCKILSNARCLTEGIDVPALDAILFLHPRKSEIDVVQAVGRVMRKAPGKQYGYIILPIAQAPNATAQETVNDSTYKAVWQVINAIAAHDDRFEAKINQLALTANPPPPPYPGGTNIGGNGNNGDDKKEPDGIQGTLLIAGSLELRDAILAKIVDKYADPGYWEKWAETIRAISIRHEARIRALLGSLDPAARETFDQFLAGIRNNLNDDIAEDDAISMLSQHLVSRPVFDALFEDYAFTALNPVSRAMQDTLESLEERGLEKETADLDNFYRDVRVCVQGLTSDAGKQQIIAVLYQRFFRLALADVAMRMGIVNTPTEVVDYVVRSVEDVLQSEFGVSVSDAGVHVIDPFVGAGTFINRLLQSGLIKPADLTRKYAGELHANDIMLLAYYIAAVNIEAAYHDRANAAEYTPFEGIVLTDTFQSYEPDDPMDAALFPRNNARMERQKALDIRVIIGNPPWSATNNRAYPYIDGRVQESYAARSNAHHLSALYDPYVKAFRLASDRVQDSANGGIVAFVTNGGFIESNAFDGFRKAVAEEFHAIYCYNLRGDARTSGDKRRQEGGGIFDSSSRAGVAILLLVKKPGKSPGATIYYRDIGDYLTRELKLDILDKSSLASTEWQTIKPNEAGDWIGQRSEVFQTMRPLAASTGNGNGDADGLAPIFNESMGGLKTNRDAWCFNSSLQSLQTNIRRSVDFYNAQVTAFRNTNATGSLVERTDKARKFVQTDAKQFHWDAKNYQHLASGRLYKVDPDGFTFAAYRPFFKQRLYFNRELNNSIRRFPEVYPNADAYNVGISITGLGSNNPFHALLTDIIPEVCLTAVNSIYLPRWRYTPAKALTQYPDADNLELDRVSNINPQAVAQLQAQLGTAITDDDLFYYTYGVLHSPQWRAAFADDLAKSPVRIPTSVSLDDFRAFARAGRDLAELHVNYETVEPYRMQEIHDDGWHPDTPNAYRVEKMGYGGSARNPDKTRIIYNAGITLAGIPAESHEYRLGTRSALDWLIDRYQVTTHKASGITNDPNDWCAEQDNPRYIVDLVKRVTAVSIKTMEIVRNLPFLPFDTGFGSTGRVKLAAGEWYYARMESLVDLKDFQRLADQWEEETMYLSNFRQMARHTAYQEIISMGIAATPSILERLQERGGHWFPVLRTITNADPVPPEDRGNVLAMTAAWLEWGKRNGYA